MLHEALENLLEGRDLTEEQAYQCMSGIMGGQVTDAQIAGFLVALRIKGETVAEITGCARAMRQAATRIDVGDLDVVDTCGTGGTHKGTFNVSTTSALVTAGAGVPVAKHGNRGASSSFGSADVLQALGVNIEAPPRVVEQCVREIGIGFLFAPLLHTAMKYAIGPRRELAIRTVFNILGPLSNPAGARRQVLGVFSRQLVEPIATVLSNLGAVRAMVVHSADGMDEISVCDRTLVARVEQGRIETGWMAPEDVGLERSPRKELRATSAGESAAVIRAVLSGEPGAPRDMVLLNAGAAIFVGGKADSHQAGMQKAAESIDSGRAKEMLKQLAELSSAAR